MKRVGRHLLVWLMLVATLSGCAAYRQCGFRGCPGDADITREVRSLLLEHPALRSSGAIDVQTWDHVVYLYGIVDTEMERRLLESVARTAPGVTQVVNLVGISNNDH